MGEHEWESLSVFIGYYASSQNEILSKYRDKLNLSYASESVKISLDTLEKFGTLLDWFYLSGNESLPLDLGFLDYFCDQLDWGSVASQKRFSPDLTMLIRFEKKWFKESLISNADKLNKIPFKDISIEDIDEVLCMCTSAAS